MDYVNLVIVFIASICIICGIFFFICATVGIIRMPDPYNRAHTVGKADSTGFLFCLIGIWLYWLTINPCQSIKILIILLFLLFANPIAIHNILRFSYKTNIPTAPGTIIHTKDEKEKNSNKIA
ncbi:MAG: monovalent cation/H(+) antiporter subunit G [bacterium]